MNIEQLNDNYGITGQLRIISGRGRLPMIQVKSSKSTALISLHAGQVLSFKPNYDSVDIMFLSEKAYYQKEKAIKGGIPICWPWFGPDPGCQGRPGHGFARNRLWNLATTEVTKNGDIKVILGLVDTHETQAIWPYSFSLMQEILIGESLNLSLITRNTGNKNFSITQGFHTYFKIGNIAQLKVMGLEGCNYIDKVDSSMQKQQVGPVTIDSQVDRIYLDVSKRLIIDDGALNRQIQITSQGCRTAVVWNPWEKISKKMPDLEDEDYQRFICVETTNAANDIVEVAPGSEYRLIANFHAIYN